MPTEEDADKGNSFSALWYIFLPSPKRYGTVCSERNAPLIYNDHFTRHFLLHTSPLNELGLFDRGPA